jgi:hypothetical protein
MKGAWIALAGLAAIGLLGLNYEIRVYDWPDRPAYVAPGARLSPSECRAWRSRAQRRAIAFPASFDAYKGFSILQGACHEKDVARGRSIVEAAIAKGAGRYLIVEYAMALNVAGDFASADAEFPLAAEVIRRQMASHVDWIPSFWRPILARARAEFERIALADDVPFLRARIDRILSRPALSRGDEGSLLRQLIRRIRALDYAESQFQEARAEEAGRSSAVGADGISLRLAAGCGHPEAIRIMAKRIISGEFPAHQSWTVGQWLLWLDSRTGVESEIIAELARLSIPIEHDRQRVIDAMDAHRRDHCVAKSPESIKFFEYRPANRSQ